MADELRPLIDYAASKGFGITIERAADGFWYVGFIRGMGGGDLAGDDDLDVACLESRSVLDDVISRMQEWKA